MLHFLCILTLHRPNRDRIWDDGLNRRTRCRSCGKPMLRDHMGWRIFKTSDHNDLRASHPRAADIVQLPPRR